MKKILMLAGILLLVGIVSAGTSYVHGPNGLIAKINETGVYYYHSDHLGSTSAMTDGGGSVVEEQLNAPFGQLISGSGRYGFTGKERDETGLQYFGARYYNPETGRFLTIDPVMQFHSPYPYAANNPLRYTDPDGRQVPVLPPSTFQALRELGRQVVTNPATKAAGAFLAEYLIEKGVKRGIKRLLDGGGSLEKSLKKDIEDFEKKMGGEVWWTSTLNPGHDVYEEFVNKLDDIDYEIMTLHMTFAYGTVSMGMVIIDPEANYAILLQEYIHAHQYKQLGDYHDLRLPREYNSKYAAIMEPYPYAVWDKVDNMENFDIRYIAVFLKGVVKAEKLISSKLNFYNKADEKLWKKYSKHYKKRRKFVLKQVKDVLVRYPEFGREYGYLLD